MPDPEERDAGSLGKGTLLLVPLVFLALLGLSVPLTSRAQEAARDAREARLDHPYPAAEVEALIPRLPRGRPGRPGKREVLEKLHAELSEKAARQGGMISASDHERVRKILERYGR